MLFFYLFTVAVSWGLIKLVWDDLSPWIALVPLANLALPVWDYNRAHGSMARAEDQRGYRVRTPQEELDREAARNSGRRTPPWIR